MPKELVPDEIIPVFSWDTKEEGARRECEKICRCCERRTHKVKFSRAFRDEDDGTLTVVNSKKYCNISHMYYNADPYILEEEAEELTQVTGPPAEMPLLGAEHSSGHNTEKYEGMSINAKDIFYSDMSDGVKSRE